MMSRQAPELPSDVSALPIPTGWWVLSLAAAALLLWWGIAWWLRLQRERRAEAAAAGAHGLSTESSAESLLQRLRESLDELSVDQEVEAGMLSQLLRFEVGFRCARDCRGATETELLVAASAPGSDTSLAPLLAFTTSILYGGRRASVGTWRRQVDEVDAWLAAAKEGTR
jgi:hypothetical protein